MGDFTQIKLDDQEGANTLEPLIDLCASEMATKSH